MTPKDVIKGFAKPEELLRHCRLKITGAPIAAPPNGAAPILTCVVTMEDRAVVGFTTGRAGKKGEQKHRDYASLTLLGVQKPGLADNEFDAYYIPMVQTSDVGGGSSHYRLPTAGGPDIMLTSQLSGCRFGTGSDANGVTLVTHIQPDQTMHKDLRQADLAVQVAQGFVNQGGTTGQGFSMGGTYTQGHKATIIGVRAGGVWHFYQQDIGYDKKEVITGLTVI